MAGKAVRIAVGADHGGFHLKGKLIRQLRSAGVQPIDVGTHSPKPCDYPAIGARVARAVSQGKVERGILLCKSGGGMAIVANKFPRVRAVVCSTAALAKHAREHNDANLLVLGSERVPSQRTFSILRVWLATPFGGGRHARRVRQIAQLERKLLKGKTRWGQTPC